MAQPDHSGHRWPGQLSPSAAALNPARGVGHLPVVQFAGPDALADQLASDNDNDNDSSSAGNNGAYDHHRNSADAPFAAQDFAEGDVAEELACLRGLLPAGLLRAATRRGRALGLGADQILIHWGAIDEAQYVRRLAAQLGTGVIRLSGLAAGRCALDGSRLAQAAMAGIVPMRLNGELVFVIALRSLGARGLARFSARYPALIGRIRLTTTADLTGYLERHGRDALAHRAADGLQRRWPELSAAPGEHRPRWREFWRALRIGSAAALIVIPPLLATGIWASALIATFLGFIALRLAGSLVPRPVTPRRHRLPEHRLPVYTIIVALYREASSVAPLLQAIHALDYPREKLDVILVIEADDSDTRAAILRLGALPHLRMLVAPAVGPQTKPKALNYALPFARGSFTAVFDAEDRPEPGQLRAALDAFAAHGERLACAQASLCIDNAAASLLSRMFAAEYAGQFDIFLPGFAAMKLPLPLGGSSNHFRTEVLRQVGAWDAYNVTEDADLGVRLARFGYGSITFASTTFEEAPIRLGPWLRQRTRWMKGWMQSWSVHMRRPRQLWRDTGPRGFLAINLIVGGNLLTALAYPSLFGGWLLLASGSGIGGGSAVDAWTPLHLTAMAAGILSTVGIGLCGLAHRRQLRHGWILLLTPLYWALLSLAAWRALWQLLRDPYRWEKTEHGVSRRSKAVRGAQVRSAALTDNA